MNLLSTRSFSRSLLLYCQPNKSFTSCISRSSMPILAALSRAQLIKIAAKATSADQRACNTDCVLPWLPPTEIVSPRSQKAHFAHFAFHSLSATGADLSLSFPKFANDFSKMLVFTFRCLFLPRSPLISVFRMFFMTSCFFSDSHSATCILLEQRGSPRQH